ncbi:hypothetical protein H2198_001504 [Neophaeococcomyces mojaviensis]|uniref:Uncharacterized protein n=1 Tax=Neophaeococcomyces mojaviensis TaxID=3383035 RepID=A0ACC3AGU0_9EURO|nr:hypothetical protein H2198_001504 [Knufia sp. JES_112]
MLGLSTSLLCLATWLGLSNAAADKNAEMKSIPLRTHSLSPPYLDSDMASRWWDFGGDTIVRADQYIRLAADIPSQSGWIFSKIPLTATNWEIEVEFSISGRGNLHGDGFALWVTKERAQPGPVFGHADKFEGLGVFFDTYKNNRPGVVFPYVMAMMGDGNTAYDSANDGKANELGGCSARGLRGATVPSKARLTYFQDKSLELQLQYKSTDSWTECFKITADDGKGPIKMPNTAYLGFSAHTGELSDNFDIVSVDTKNLYSPVAGQGGRGSQGGPPTRNNNQFRSSTKESGGWGWFFFKIIAFVLLVGGAYFGYNAYRTKQRREYRGF